MHDQLSLDEVRERIEEVRVAMVTTPEADGALSSRPLTIQRIGDDGDVEFLIDRDAGWAVEGQNVDVAIVDDGRTWVSVSGQAAYIDDRAVVDELWDEISEQFFDGPQDAIVMRVDAVAWSYWAAPNRVAQVYELAKAVVTDRRPDLGTSGVITP
jgi:general stress protein 26